jgi:hypothetical protein
MNIDDMIRNALDMLISDGTFQIERIDYDEKNFGNIYVVLSSSKRIYIRFINDRGEFWCEIGHAGEWYFAEDVFTLIGVESVSKNTDIINYVQEMAVLIKANIPSVFQAFSEKYVKDTQIKIKTLATRRAMGMFKF